MATKRNGEGVTMRLLIFANICMIGVLTWFAQTGFAQFDKKVDSKADQASVELIQGAVESKVSKEILLQFMEHQKRAHDQQDARWNRQQDWNERVLEQIGDLKGAIPGG